MASHILDGYSLEQTIPGRGPWKPLTFRYRPAVAEKTYEYLAQAAQGKKRLAVNAKLLVEHLVSWDVADPNDDSKTVPVTEEHVKRLPAVFIDEMVAVVTSYSTLEQEGDVKN